MVMRTRLYVTLYVQNIACLLLVLLVLNLHAFQTKRCMLLLKLSAQTLYRFAFSLIPVFRLCHSRSMRDLTAVH